MKHLYLLVLAASLATPAIANDLDDARKTFAGYPVSRMTMAGGRLTVDFQAQDMPEESYTNIVYVGFCLPILSFTKPDAFKTITSFEARINRVTTWYFNPRTDIHSFCRNTDQTKFADAVLNASQRF